MVFGRFGDKAGRKATFLVTIVVMGLSTAGIGVFPSFQSIGWLSPILLVTLRMLQGRAIGGKYRGAATYIAEHSRPNRRGFTTGFLQTTATFGFLLSLGIALFCKALVSAEDFASWGWRLPFLISLVLLAVSTYIRTTLSESLTFMNIQLHHVIATITGVTGLRIIRAIVAGERDPDRLAAMRDAAARKVLRPFAMRWWATTSPSTYLP